MGFLFFLNLGTVKSQDEFPNKHLARKGQWESKEKHTDAGLAIKNL